MQTLYAPTAAEQRVSTGYILISLIAVLLTFLFHELAHVITGESLGYHMTMTINSASPANGPVNDGMDAILISSAGPLFTLLQAALFYVLLLKRRSIFPYPFLFVPLYMRLLAGVMNLFVVNDEGSVSSKLGIGTFTLSILICLLLGAMVYHVSKKRQFTKKFQLINFFLAMAFTSALILLNQYLELRLIS